MTAELTKMVTSDDSVTYANTPATGVPTITGTVQVGEELTANIDNIADVDGLRSARGASCISGRLLV